MTLFAPLLLRARQHAFLEHGALVSRHDLAFDAKWLGGRKDPNESILGHPDASSLADISSGFEHVLQMWTVPIDRVTLFRFLLAAALPFLPLAFLTLSLAELGERLLKLVF